MLNQINQEKMKWKHIRHLRQSVPFLRLPRLMKMVCMALMTEEKDILRLLSWWYLRCLNIHVPGIWKGSSRIKIATDGKLWDLDCDDGICGLDLGLSMKNVSGFEIQTDAQESRYIFTMFIPGEDLPISKIQFSRDRNEVEV